VTLGEGELEVYPPGGRGLPNAGLGATAMILRLARSLEMMKRGSPRSAAAVPGRLENSLPEVLALRYGDVVDIRAVSLGDGELLRRMFSRLSRESIYRRFHMPYPSVPQWAVALFMGVHGPEGNTSSRRQETR
jgi:hypothetical protein